VVVVDVHMPGMDGLTLRRKIHQDPALSGAVILMLSSMDLTSSGLELRDLGHHVMKPVTRDNLLKAVPSVL
jgi:CheY-like chemotaxis protein